MHQQVEFVGAMRFNMEELDLSSLLIFSIFSSLSAFVVCRLISYINIYHLFECQHYITRFLSSSCQLEFSFLEVKYDRFRNRDEGTWQKPLEILTTKDRWSELLTYITDVVQPEETNRWKTINTHTHTGIKVYFLVWQQYLFFVNQKINNCIGENDTSCLESLTC